MPFDALDSWFKVKYGFFSDETYGCGIVGNVVHIELSGEKVWGEGRHARIHSQEALSTTGHCASKFSKISGIVDALPKSFLEMFHKILLF